MATKNKPTPPVATRNENISRRMSEEFDLGNHETTFRYTICSSPRSGSNYLCSILRESGIAGSPMEYFNPQYLNAFLERLDKKSIPFPEIMKELHARRTSPNGYFGNKVQFWQLKALFQKEMKVAVAHIRAQNHLIYLYRKDKIEQAVSLYLAQQTGAFSAEDSVNSKEIQYSPAAIAKCLHLNVKDDFSWQIFLKKSGVKFTTVCYEDLISDREKQMAIVWKDLGLEVPKKISENALSKKQTHPQYDEFVKKFKTDMGF